MIFGKEDNNMDDNNDEEVAEASNSPDLNEGDDVRHRVMFGCLTLGFFMSFQLDI